MSMLEKFLPRTEFDSYEDFKANYRVNVPENFNFAYDVMDEYARTTPDREALLWCNEQGDEKHYTFAQVKFGLNRLFKSCVTAYIFAAEIEFQRQLFIFFFPLEDFAEIN